MTVDTHVDPYAGVPILAEFKRSCKHVVKAERNDYVAGHSTVAPRTLAQVHNEEAKLFGFKNFHELRAAALRAENENEKGET